MKSNGNAQFMHNSSRDRNFRSAPFDAMEVIAVVTKTENQTNEVLRAVRSKSDPTSVFPLFHLAHKEISTQSLRDVRYGDANCVSSEGNSRESLSHVYVIS
jgi:hypothetical protein